MNRKVLASRLAPDRIRAATKITLMSFLVFGGVSLSVVGWLLGHGDWSLVLAAFGATMACTGFTGLLVYYKVLNSIIVAEDIVEVSKMPDPAETGKPVAIMVPKDESTKTLLFGPTRLTVAQWDLIYKATKKAHGKWSRKIGWEDSGANVSNVNRVYGMVTRWMLDNRLINNSSGNSSRPEYYLTKKGHWAMEEVTSGRVPGSLGGDS